MVILLNSECIDHNHCNAITKKFQQCFTVVYQEKSGGGEINSP
jgi:hypothetical protein